MATEICKTINSLFSIEPNTEEKNAIESFINDSDKLTLNVTKNKSLKRLIFEMNSENDDDNHHQYTDKNEVIVFVKMKSREKNESDDIFDQSDKIAELSSLISECTADQSSIMNTLSELRKYYKLENIMISLKSQREILFEKIINWAENSYDNYEKNEEEKNEENNSTSATVRRISLLKAKESKLKAVVRVCDVLFNDINGYQATKAKIFKHEIKEIIEEYNTLFRRWCNKWDTINLDTSKSCIEIDNRTQIPFVTFDPRLVKLSQQCRTLSALGFILPENIMQSKNNIRKYSLIARELREIVNFYCTIGEKILLSQRPMLIDAAKVFTQLLEFKNSIKWNQEPDKLRLWLDELKEFSKKFSTENKLLLKKHNSILKLVLELFEIIPSKWKSNMNEIQKIFRAVDGKYANTLTWKIHWDYQLYKILEYHFNVAIIKCNEWLGFTKSSLDSDQSHLADNTLRIELSFIRSQVSFQPSLEEIQSKIYQRIKKFLNMPISFEGFVNSSSTTSKTPSSIFKTIYIRNFTAFTMLYDEANKIITELKEIENTFKQWTSLYSIVATYTNTPTQLNNILKLDSLDDYQNNLIMIKSKAQDFNKIYFNSEILCKTANIQINITPIKLLIEWIYMEMDKLLVLCLKYETESRIKELQQSLDDTLIKLTTNPKNISALNGLELFMQNELNTLCDNFTIKYNELENRINFLNKWRSQLAPNLSELSSKYDELQGLYENKNNLLLSFKNQLKSNIESTIYTFTEEVETLLLRSKSLQEKNNNTNISAAITDDDDNNLKNNNIDIHEIYLQLMSLEEDKIQIIDGCNYFHIKQPIIIEKFDQLTAIIYEMDSKLNLMNEFENGLQIYKELEWIVCRHKLTAIENYINHWEEENANINTIIKRKLTDWRDFINLLKSCRGECFSSSHWLEFFNILNLDKSINYETLKFYHLIEKKEKILVNKELIKELNSRAIGSSFIIDTFNELDTFARETSFDFYSYKCDNDKELKLINNWRFVLDKIAEAIFTLNLIKSSEYFTNEFEEKGSKWENQLYLLDSIVNTLNLIQRKWTYLEPIYFKNFKHENFDQTNHSYEHNFSQNADTNFSNIMSSITDDPHIMNLLRIPQLQSKLNDIDSELTLRQKKLTYFMEKSRNRFPRFYFLADDDLLLVLAGKVSINESNLLKKLFNNTIIKVHINNESVSAIESPEGEIVELIQPVKMKSKEAIEIENWLKQLESSIQESLKKSLFKLIKSDNNDYDNDDIWSSPSQIVSVYQWIKFTIKVEEAIKYKRLVTVKKEYVQKLEYLTSANTNNDIHKIKIKSLILDVIHFLNVIEELIELSVDDIDDWQWIKQLRYYVVQEKDQKVKISMGLGYTYYSFEYIGCYGSSKLVHTPLTDKCYLVCMQAIALGLGANPYGPAGTGKTETIKALGQQLGRSVLVFNCDEAIDIKAMTRILIGIIQCGAWGCFDEFNRLQVDVLSSLSSQIQYIQNSLRKNLPKVTLDSNEIVLNHYSAIFVTLNPAGKQYKGRNKLPDNLKTLFLPIAMTAPDSSIISRVILLSEGFELEKSRELGEKITLWFHLAKDCMSSQKHYDWGLRALKSCLSSSGCNLRLLTEANNKHSIDEINLVVRSLRTQIKSKLINEDEKHFDELIIDVFGNNYSDENSNENSNDQLRMQIMKVFTESNLIPLEDQIKKVIELNEQLNSRLGVALIGDTGTGKSTIWHALIKLRKLQGIIITPVVINPKSMSRKHLLGFIDEETREWHDGVLTLKSRSISRDNSSNFYWIIFDGCIDPEWVEALNSVLDDNRILTLPSGERIDFNQSKVNILFETTNLFFASPATISRLGIIATNTSKVKPYLMSHIKDTSYSVDYVYNIINNNTNENIISKARTAIVLIKKLATNTKFEVDNILEYFNPSVELFNQYESYKIGEFIVTSSSKRIISFINILNDYDSHILLIGNRGIGKHKLLCETIFKGSKLISIDCNPETLPEEVIKLLKTECITINTGSSISLRSNEKIIIYIRNLELLEEDKWRSITLIEFLFTLITYHGFYDTNCQWIHLDNFQIIATSITSESFNTRLISLFNIVKMEISNINELEIILKLRIASNNAANNGDSGWHNTFPNKYISICQNLMKKFPHIRISIIKNGFKIINILERYNEITNDALWLETFRSLQEYLPDSNDYVEFLKNNCDNVFGKKSKHISLATNYGSVIMLYNIEEAYEFFRRSVTNWIVNNEILSPQIVLIDETVNLLAELSIFLSSSAIIENNGLILLGSSGSGRKIATRVMAHAFNYEEIWSPGINCTEKQLIQELQAFTSIDREDRKTILLIDQEHFHLLKFLTSNLIRFTKNVRKYPVKIILVMNNLSGKYSILSRTYNIYRVEKWSADSLLKIPQLIINNLDENILNGFSKILQQFPDIYKNCRRFMSFVHTFTLLYNNKIQEIENKRNHLDAGVCKLEEVNTEVIKLKKEAEQQQEILALKRLEADTALDLITSSMHSSEDQKIELEDIKKKTEKESSKLTIRKKEIEKDLKDIEPILQAAKIAVGGIKSEALSEIRSLRAPPETIRHILEGVLRLMGVNDTSWVSMKSFLSRRGVKEEIINFDSRKITPEMRIKVENLLNTKAESFNEKYSKRASIAAVPLANWVKANISYSKVLHKIKPLEDEQKQLEDSLRSAELRMKSLTKELKGVELEVGSLRDKLNQVTVEAAEIEINLKQTKDTLNRSEILIEELSNEYERWCNQLNECNIMLEACGFNCLIISLYVHLAGILSSKEERHDLLNKCFELFDIKNLNICQFLKVQNEEELFIKVPMNLLTRLFIDPSQKLLKYYKNYDILNLTKKDKNRIIELNLRFGKTTIIQEIDKLDLLLLPLMRKLIYGNDGSRNWIYLGEKRIDYNSQFELIIFINEPIDELMNSSLVNVINLMPNTSNTIDELLRIIISNRRPELEERKLNLDSNKYILEEKLNNLEEQLLEKLSTSSGNLLNNYQLIDSLKEIKRSSKEIQLSLNESLTIENDINHEREQYTELAITASKLLFYIQELSQLNSMYKFGIREYHNLFIDSLKAYNSLTSSKLILIIYEYISKGLYTEDAEAFKKFLISQLPENSNLFTNTNNSNREGNSLKVFLNTYLKSRSILLIIISPGSDPIPEILSSLSDNNVNVLSMASDVIEKAESLIEKELPIICLTNLHLVIDWCTKLTNLLSVSSNKTSYILVTQAHDNFPSSLLKISIKYVYYSSLDLRSTINNLINNASNNNSYNENEIKQLNYFHSICCERCNYIPFGWSKEYDFGYNNYQLSLNIMEMIRLYLGKDRRKQLQYIRHILANIIYGSKLDNKVDENILNVLIKDWFTEFNLNNKHYNNSYNYINLDSVHDELALLGLSTNANKRKIKLLKEKITKSLHLLMKATNIQLKNEEIKHLKDILAKRIQSNYNDNSSQIIQSPIKVLIFSEYLLVNNLMDIIKSDLNNSKSINNSYLNRNETPETWLNIYESGSNKASEFIENLIKIENYLIKNFNHDNMDIISINNFIHPSSVLNLLRQIASRTLGINIDIIKHYCSWGKTLSPSLISNKYYLAKIDGFLIEGALFNGMLTDCNSDTDIQSNLPILYLYFFAQDQSSPYETEVISLPVYAASSREHLITWLDMPCKSGSTDHWIKAGVALITNFTSD